jgi:integrase
MKPENNWQYKTLENLEKVKWPDFDSDSRLITRTKQLRRIPLNDFTIEDLRLMIGQQIGLDYLVLLALDKLKENLWAGGDYFEGDLLENIFGINVDFWKKNQDLWFQLRGLIDGKQSELKERKIETGNFYKIG